MHIDTSLRTEPRTRLAPEHRSARAGRALVAVLLTACCSALAVSQRALASAAVAVPPNQTAMDYFLGRGLTNYQAAGIVGNLDQESGMNPTATQTGGAGRGVAQWSVGGRWDHDVKDNVVAYASTRGQSPWSLSLQLDFIWYELTSFPGYGLAQLQATTNVSDATVVFENRYEICGNCQQSNRINYAQAALSAYGNDAGSTYVPLAPTRILDTRNGVGGSTLGGGKTLSLPVTGRGGVPSSSVTAVALNVTVVAPTAQGWVTVYGDGSARPTASNVNFGVGQTVANLVVAPVGADGRVDLVNGSFGSIQLIGDISGYYLGGAQSVAGAFVRSGPTRVLDTRSGVGAPRAAIGGRQTASLAVANVAGVPSSGVSAVALTVTVTSPSAGGWITAYGDGATASTASNVNFAPGQTVANLVVVPVGSDGRVDLFNGSPGSVQLIADVSGYYLGGTPAVRGAFAALPPSRVLDTRSGLGGPRAAVGGGQTASLAVHGSGGVPSSGVSAVVLTVTVSSPSAPGFITVFGNGSPRPTASNLNFAAGQTVANLVVAPVGPDGRVQLFNGSLKATQIIADVAGYYLSGP